MDAPVGPTGIHTCGAKAPPRWRAGASFGVSDTDLDFGAAGKVGARECAATATLGLRLIRGLSVSAAVGSVLGGQVGAQDLSPGFLVAGTASYVVQGEALFLVGSATLAYAFADPLRSRDIRVGVAAGHAFGALDPYFAARVFAGGVDWGTLHGGDANHYQVGLGASLRLGDLDVIAEAMPLGERSFTVGTGWSF